MKDRFIQLPCGKNVIASKAWCFLRQPVNLLFTKTAGGLIKPSWTPPSYVQLGFFICQRTAVGLIGSKLGFVFSSKASKCPKNYPQPRSTQEVLFQMRKYPLKSAGTGPLLASGQVDGPSTLHGPVGLGGLLRRVWARIKAEPELQSYVK